MHWDLKFMKWKLILNGNNKPKHKIKINGEMNYGFNDTLTMRVSMGSMRYQSYAIPS